MKVSPRSSFVTFLSVFGLLHFLGGCSKQDPLQDEAQGANTQTQTSFSNAQLASCTATVATQKPGQTLVKELQLSTRIRHNNDQKTPEAISGTYTERISERTNGTLATRTIRQITLTTDTLDVLRANASLIDISTTGAAIDRVQKKEFFVSGVFISPSSKKLSIQLKDEAANATVLDTQCQTLANLWLYFQSHVSGADKPRN